MARFGFGHTLIDYSTLAEETDPAALIEAISDLQRLTVLVLHGRRHEQTILGEAGIARVLNGTDDDDLHDDEALMQSLLWPMDFAIQQLKVLHAQQKAAAATPAAAPVVPLRRAKRRAK